MKHSITRQQMEVFAQLLETVKRQQALSTDEFDNLHTRFHGEDAGGIRWTVGIHTRNWNRRDHGRWVPGTAPEELRMEEEVATALWELLSKQWAARGAPTPPPEAVVPQHTVCRGCGTTLKPNTRFCVACGIPAMPAPVAPVAAVERRCSRCGQLLPAGKKFCTRCGTPF